MRHLTFLIALLVLAACENAPTKPAAAQEKKDDFVMVFASCNDQNRKQPLWKPILENQPDLFVWGGDNIYSDTDDMAKMESDYKKVLANPDYQKLLKVTTITGTWDDHDYGKDDGGVEWRMKKEAQKLFLDFIKAPENDPRRRREGVYTSKRYNTPKGSMKLILLDTRTFRDSIKPSEKPAMRYDPWEMGEGGTILGDMQWRWLEDELKDDTTEFTVIVSSIQFLSKEHGWEKWGNHPSEVEKMKSMMAKAKAKNIIMLSGDRHLAEISKSESIGLGYPLIDFTSSGLTHTWINSATEKNEYRISNVVKQLNFGVLRFDFDSNQVKFEIRGADNFLYESYVQQY